MEEFPDDWTGAWVRVDRDGTPLEAEPAGARDLEEWLAPAGLAALRACADLEWAGIADVRFPTRNGRWVRLSAREEAGAWRLTCLDVTLLSQIEGFVGVTVRF